MISRNRFSMRRGVAVVGSTTIDQNAIGARRYLKLGGVTVYSGLTYRRHGLPTWVSTSVAPADSAILAPLRQAGIRVLRGESLLTTRFVNRVLGRARLQEVLSVAAPLQHRQIAALVERVDLIHLGPLHPEDIAVETYERLAPTPLPVVLDLQGLVRRIAGRHVRPAVSAHLAAALHAADVVKANEAELQHVLAAQGAGIAELMARFQVSEWVVTGGSDGGRIYGSDGGVHPYPAQPVGEPLDPTGAGDVFLAAYAAARFAQGKTIAAASRQAARIAAEQLAGRYIPAFQIELGDRPSGPNGVDNTSNEG